uniref:Uncharacterized protein n=1 Tax=Anguilla anguilla TaxID=7936 RepID=A0A0E9VRK7_ANGAN
MENNPRGYCRPRSLRVQFLWVSTYKEISKQQPICQ